MYQIFFNNRTVHFILSKDQPTPFDAFTVAQWEELVIDFECRMELQSLEVPVSNPKAAFDTFCGVFEIMPAAGGVVTNPQGDTLLIYRLGKWDLPKGKVEKGESWAQAALREVEEETGIRGLVFSAQGADPTAPVAPLTVTYHTYRYQGRLTLKVTYWYNMYVAAAAAVRPLQPQTEEGIEAVAWVGALELPHHLANTYASIRTVFAANSQNYRKGPAPAVRPTDLISR